MKFSPELQLDLGRIVQISYYFALHKSKICNKKFPIISINPRTIFALLKHILTCTVNSDNTTLKYPSGLGLQSYVYF